MALEERSSGSYCNLIASPGDLRPVLESFQSMQRCFVGHDVDTVIFFVDLGS